MISKELVAPKSIAIIGASNDILSPGGNLLKNLIINNYEGNIYVVSENSSSVQGISTYKKIQDIPDTDLAFMAEDNGSIFEDIQILCMKKTCKAIVVFPDKISSAKITEREALIQTRKLCSDFRVTLIGPNSAGIANKNFCGLYTKSSVKKDGNIQIISSSRTIISKITESSGVYGFNIGEVYSLGYSPLTTIEEILEWMDDNWSNNNKAHRVIAIYIERIANSQTMITKCRSLIGKGASIVGVLASPNEVVAALFSKCGIIRAYDVEEMVNIVSILSKGRPNGKNISILTQAGGPAVLLADVLRQNGVNVPTLFFEDYSFGKTSGHLSSLVDANEKNPDIDGTVVIFGEKETSNSSEVSNVIFRKIRQTKKPVYPLFVSESSYEELIKEFHHQGGISFTDEVIFGRALAKVINAPMIKEEGSLPAIDKYLIKRIIDESPNGFMPAFMVQELLDASGINRLGQHVALEEEEAINAAVSIGYPVVLKVLGPLHKTEVDGVSLNITDEHTLVSEYRRMSNIEGVTGFIVQPMIDDHVTELQVSCVREPNFPPLVSCSLGGIFADAMQDISYCLSPISAAEAEQMIQSLKAYPIIKGYREQEGVNEVMFGDIIRRLSALCLAVPEITRIELNPIFGNERDVCVVGARVKIDKN